MGCQLKTQTGHRDFCSTRQGGQKAIISPLSLFRLPPPIRGEREGKQRGGSDERARFQVLLYHQERRDPRAQGGTQFPVQGLLLP